MSSVIICDGISKKYKLNTMSTYEPNTLREVITDSAKNLLSRKNKPVFVDFWALKNINFDIKVGDRVGIIGRNGAGKSTLLKLLSRITAPTSGTIKMRGRTASLLEVGTGFHPELTGRENIFLNGSILGMSKFEIQKKFDEIVSFAEIDKFLDTPVKRYSSGMYVRLAFSIAAHIEPEILIVDEVLAVGDYVFQKKCLGRMEDVSKEGRTILFVSHNSAALQFICNKGILFKQGELIYQGDINSALSNYISKGELNIINQLPKPVTIDLSQIPRKSSKNVFLSATVSSENSADIITTISTLTISLEINSTLDLKGLDYAVRISNSLGQPIFTLATWMFKNCINNSKVNFIDFKIPKLLLIADTYSLTFSAVNRQSNEWLDYLEHCILFEVVESNLFDTGETYSRADGVIVINGNILIHE